MRHATLKLFTLAWAGLLPWLIPAQASADQHIVVAKSGGNFTSVSAALASITPSASNRFVIDVMPGTYIGSITMKNYVHLRGAGREVTILKAPSVTASVITLNGLNTVAISGLTIQGVDNSGGGKGLSLNSSTATIIGNTITTNTYGIYNNNNSSPAISGNIIAGNGEGIVNVSSFPSIVDNTIAQNGGGILETASLSTIKGNTIRGYTEGIRVQSSASPDIIQNQITDAGAGSVDIIVESGTPNISFNVFDTIIGSGTGVGRYNVTSNGGAAPAP